MSIRLLVDKLKIGCEPITAKIGHEPNSKIHLRNVFPETFWPECQENRPQPSFPLPTVSSQKNSQ